MATTCKIHEKILIAVIFATSAMISFATGQIPVKGEIILKTGFETEKERAAWTMSPYATWDAGFKSRHSIRITVSEGNEKGMHAVRMPLDIEKYRSCKLSFSCKARAENVTKPPFTWLGVKAMLHIKSKNSAPIWINENNIYGTFDWKALEFMVAIPGDAESAELSLGLQDSSGTVRFDDLYIEVLRSPLPPIPAPIKDPPPVFKGHSLPRLRGVMSPNSFHEDDIRVLGRKWNANLIRWQITRNWGKSGTDRNLEEYEQWINSKIKELDSVLDSCLRHGIKVVIDLHSPPGGRYENKDMAMFFEKEYQDYFVKLWENIAVRFKDHKAVWGYDLVNEPTQTKPSPDGVEDFLGTQLLAARAIRKIDPDVPIFISPDQWGSPDAFKELRPIPVSNIIYQVHYYMPHRYTHQGVHSKWEPVSYPGEISGVKWDSDQIRKILQPVRDFQIAFNTHIYVGEFSAVRWAPGAPDYLRDCIEIFEEYDWDWSYHAFREWEGWSLEHTGEPGKTQRSETPTDRFQVIADWFQKNISPKQ